jgi:chemotaxis protein CheY-P-specific phosphatase CheC
MSGQIENPTMATCELSSKAGPYTCLQPQPGELGILLELGSIGAGHAATSLSDIIQQQVVIDIPKIHKIPPNMLPKFYEKHEWQRRGHGCGEDKNYCLRRHSSP